MGIDPLSFGLGAGSDVAGSLVGAGISYGANKNLQRQGFNNAKKLQKQQFELSQLAQQNSMSNLALGARRAGLNPASVVGGSPVTPAIAGGSPSSPPIGMPNIGVVESAKNMELLDAQKENIQSQTNLNDAKAGEANESSSGKMLENQFTRDYNKSFALFVRAEEPKLYAAMKEKAEKDAKANGGTFDEDSFLESLTPGTLAGVVGYQDAVTEKMAAFNAQRIEQAIAAHPEYAEAIAKMKPAELNKYYAEAGYMRALTDTQENLRARLDSEISLNEEEKKKIQKQIDEIGQNIDESKARIDRMTSEKFKNYTVGAGMLVDGVMSVATKGKSGAMTAPLKEPLKQSAREEKSTKKALDWASKQQKKFEAGRSPKLSPWSKSAFPKEELPFK